jgi:2-C-methyl-D-erythritol 4-phosphate cytidylyltransferase
MIPRRLPARHYFALIPAAGAGTRVGADLPKQYLSLVGKPVLQHVLDTFSSTAAIAHTFVVVSRGDPHIDVVMAAGSYANVTVLRVGGTTRQQSVMNGLQAMRDAVAEDDCVLVHDAARPGLTPALIDKLIVALQDDEVGGLLALPVVDTLKRADGAQRIEATVARDHLWSAQTPQMFPYALLRRALAASDAVTDEASAVELLGLKPRLVEGSPRNFKITMAQDLALAELFLKGLA